MGMAAKHSLRIAAPAVFQRVLCYLVRQPQPDGVEPLQESHDALPTEGDLLQMCVKDREQIGNEAIADQEAIELVSVDGQMTDATKLPFVFLVNRDTDKVRHHFRQPEIVVALDPNHLDTSFGIRKLPDIAEKLPVLFLETAEIQIAEDVAQQNQTPE